jgi:hypothetical protein
VARVEAGDSVARGKQWQGVGSGAGDVSPVGSGHLPRTKVIRKDKNLGDR